MKILPEHVGWCSVTLILGHVQLVVVVVVVVHAFHIQHPVSNISSHDETLVKEFSDHERKSIRV